MMCFLGCFPQGTLERDEKIEDLYRQLILMAKAFKLKEDEAHQLQEAVKFQSAEIENVFLSFFSSFISFHFHDVCFSFAGN